MDEETTKETVKNVSVFTPLIYLAVLITALMAFAAFYRKRKINAQIAQTPFFGRNLPREMYFELKESTPKPHDKVLKAALIRWGAESVRRTIKLKEVTPSMTQLYQKGSIGDDLWDRFQKAQKLEELEIQEVVRETEQYKSGWVQKFVPLLQEVCFNEALRRRYSAIEERKLDLLEMWAVELDKEGHVVSYPNKSEAVEKLGGPKIVQR